MIIRRKPLSESTKKKISLANSGINNGQWKGGKTHNAEGYVLIKMENHPFSNCRGYMFEHRLIMEKKLGRYLTKKEVVHHINKKESDNRIENLILFPTNKSHMEYHRGLISAPIPKP